MALSDISSLLPLAQATDGPGGFPPGVLMMVFFMLAMWFLLIAPQRKRQKAHDKMLTELKSGDEVVTAGGIHGTITNVKDDRFVVRIADGVKIELSKNSVGSKTSA
ncbi:MAG: preprotein translocase subunit YajC [Coraliomargarita sp.]